MKKEKILFIALPILCAVAAILAFIFIGKEEVNKDALKFKEEYESINGKKVYGNTVRSLEISSDNPIVYTSANDIITMMDNNETFVVYFGFADCPWCRSVLPTLLDVADDLKIDKIYYVDVKEIRNKLDVDDEGNVIIVKEGSEGYIGLLKRFDDVLEDYTLEYDGEEIKTGEKRIYAPNVVSIVNGVAKELETGISDKQEDAYQELTDEMKKETYDKFKCSIKCVLENKNVCSSKNAC